MGPVTFASVVTSILTPVVEKGDKESHKKKSKGFL